MTSKIKVDNIENQCGGAVVTKCGGTTTISGSVVKANNIQASDAGNIISQCGTAITIGASGDTVSLASGASQSGFGRSGSVDWQTGDIKTSTFTPENGKGYFINSGSSITANLPAGSAGAIVAFSDYARNFSTYSFTISANGSEKIGGSTDDAVLSTDGQALTLVYVDSTKGWVNVQNAEDTETGVAPFLVKYLVVAGGGGGGGANGGPGSGGGGAGGYRIRYDTPLNAPADITLFAGTTYPITVGAGGANGSSPPGCRTGTNGSNSIFSSITSAGGGGGAGGGDPSSPNALAGGSGGGGSYKSGSARLGGAGNTPPVSPPQGNAGQDGQTGNGRGEGGGGAGAVGNSGSGNAGGPGGAGVASCISGTPTTKATGGTGGSYNSACGANSPANSGNGGNGTGSSSGGGTGGSGIVYVRYPTSGAPPTVGQSGGSSATVGSCTVVTYTGPGSFTA